MLSVNSQNGQVWYHSWHGRYIPAPVEQQNVPAQEQSGGVDGHGH